MLDTTANTDNAAADTDDEDVQHVADMRIYMTIGNYMRLRNSGASIMGYCGAFRSYRAGVERLPPCRTCDREHEMWRQGV